MNNRAHINQELESIAPGLITASAAMPYTLPPHYFKNFAESVLSVMKEEPEQYTAFTKTNAYRVPEGYFENLPEILLQRVRNETFVEESDFWNRLPKANPYGIPAGYFDNFPAVILQRVKEESITTVPVGYFENLPEQLLAKVRKLDAAKELDEVAPLLNSISRQAVQHVPAGYFENLVPAVNTRKQEAPVKITPAKTNWLRYAVAASVILLLAFGAYFLFDQKSSPVPSVANQPTVNVINEQLAKLDASTIEHYLKSNNAAVQVSFPESGVENLDSDDLNEVLKGFSDQDLKKNIEETPELPAVTNLHT